MVDNNVGTRELVHQEYVKACQRQPDGLAYCTPIRVKHCLIMEGVFCVTMGTAAAGACSHALASRALSTPSMHVSISHRVHGTATSFQQVMCTSWQPRKERLRLMSGVWVQHHP